MSMYKWERQFFTDYPILELGDKSGKLAPMREIEILSYDGNKYCKVKIVGTQLKEPIKSCYIFKKITRRQLKKYEND